jgi:hypothetical protein
MTMNHLEHTMIWLLLAATIALGSMSCDEERDEAALIMECFQHTGEPDDPCPSGCWQVKDSFQRVVWTGDGTCGYQFDSFGAFATPKFCAPGNPSEYNDGIDNTWVHRRLDMASPNGSSPVIPEDVRVMNLGVPGWEYCSPDTSPLCKCAEQFSDAYGQGDRS